MFFSDKGGEGGGLFNGSHLYSAGSVRLLFTPTRSRCVSEELGDQISPGSALSVGLRRSFHRTVWMRSADDLAWTLDPRGCFLRAEQLRLQRSIPSCPGHGMQILNRHRFGTLPAYKLHINEVINKFG